MKYKFKTDYVYIYYTDDKGTQGKIAYKKGDIVDVFSPLGGNPFSGANVLVKVTPFKAYDMLNKEYVTKNNIEVRNAFLEVVNEYPQGELEEVKTDKSDIKNQPQPESKQSKIFTTNNILIGLAAIAIIGMGYYIIKK
jgi:hypothetical protein